MNKYIVLISVVILFILGLIVPDNTLSILSIITALLVLTLGMIQSMHEILMLLLESESRRIDIEIEEHDSKMTIEKAARVRELLQQYIEAKKSLEGEELANELIKIQSELGDVLSSNE